jgi:hypothetical protein
MADVFFTHGKRAIADQAAADAINLVGTTVKIALVDSTYAPSPDDQFVDDGSANDVTSHEISVTGYTGGFGGSGRKSLAGKSITADLTNDRAEFDATDVTWTALGTGATIGGAVLIKERTADTDSQVIAFFDLTNTPTNGGDVTLSFNVEGLLNF